MVGLTWGDTQANLSLMQYAGIIGNMALWLTQKASVWLVVLTTALIFTVFWNDSASLDTDWLFRQGEKYREATWNEFLQAMPKQTYIQYQTPFYPYWISRKPVLWFQQLLIVPIVIFNGILIMRLFGNTAQYILATPLYCVLSSQPSTDILMFSLVLVSLRAYQLGYMMTSAVFYGVSWLAKPLTLTVLPAMVWYLRGYILSSLMIWGTYIFISSHYAFGQKQYHFIRHQLLQEPFSRKYSGQGWIKNAIQWRVKTVTLPTLKAFWFWLFPAYLNRITLVSVCIGLGILLGYGNIKYFLLWSLFLFPIKKVNYA